jgi:hypothetical protein
VDRHLLPEEIDQLLDGEVGFGTAPLKAHVRSCARCRGELDAARALVQQIEHLPHFAPSAGFADRVMAQVQVFVPWHVALADTVRRWVPRTRTGRSLAWTGVGVAGVVLAVVSLWILAHLETAIFAVSLVLDRARAATAAAVSGLLAALFGDGAVHALWGSGVTGLVVALLLLLLAAALAARALGRLVAGARRR